MAIDWSLVMLLAGLAVSSVALLAAVDILIRATRKSTRSADDIRRFEDLIQRLEGDLAEDSASREKAREQLRANLKQWHSLKQRRHRKLIIGSTDTSSRGDGRNSRPRKLVGHH